MKYRSIMEEATNGILLISDVIEECNTQACILWGREPREMIGRTLAEISPRVQPDGRESAEVAAQHMAAALADIPQSFAWWHLRKDGAAVDMDMFVKAIRVDGKTALLLIARDVTEQRRMEEELRQRNEFIETIMENMPIGLGVITFDDHTMRYMNRRIEEIVGWPREALNDLEQFWQYAIPDPTYREEVLGKINRDLERGDPSQMFWEVRITKSSGETAVNLWTTIPMFERNLLIATAQNYTEQRRAEEELRWSEMQRVQLQAELDLAAQVQRKLLPVDLPQIAGLEIAALCLPARQAGGDFYDWQETVPGTLTLAFGDIMGKGMAAAMLMATVRATLRAVIRGNGPAAAVQLAEQALWHDLDGSESFVTLFLAQIDGSSGEMSYVDCGHGYVFLRRRNGSVQELLPRGLPLGVRAEESYSEGSCVIEEGDALILYSDGLLEPELGLNIDHGLLSERVAGATHARKMVELIAALVEPSASLPDDMTILVMRRREGE
ncbi:hypothetical protein GURASL_05540 [Geotalea uraniireducens]|uniref:PAC domain-containing protein n=1 Tax=Geotalea uraniireducens TaxID=351604 RepID=A0ABM8EGT2_9BACT|nr:SpoIIE family protein phosphatase [Geotalea uraniireducens]BDV41631.1 hypothetical protein GURASL_05540 [Geotalea uraniireducens]